MTIISLLLASLAALNAGVVTTIWSANPLSTALADGVIFGQKLRCHHLAGILCIILCSVLLATKEDEDSAEGPKLVKAWIPVVFALLTTVCFTANLMALKHFKREDMFPMNDLMFSTFALVNLIALPVSIGYWVFVEFELKLLILGLISGFCASIGKFCS